MSQQNATAFPISSPVIDIKNLSKSFAGKPAVQGISLQVNAGEIFGFLGPNGSGKTTTIRMLCGLLIPDSGEGQCLGYDIIKEAYAIKKQVGYMPQRFSLYEDLSIYENLDFIARIYNLANREERIEASLIDLGLQNRSQQLAGTLSGGWKQRLALAAALLHEPKLLLLDEPTAGVDPKARRDFWDHIHLLGERGITALVSTHYMDEAERCHRLAYIMNGILMVSGTARQVIQASGLMTWQVTGANLRELSRKLTQHSQKWQVTAFGNTLHISYPQGSSLTQDIALFSDSQWHWQQVSPNLEDVFVHLTQQQENTP
ncbi:MAG TPA: ABC transporter ATP-binding protein [Gammaproteobacteria bacterium]|nr:ABC transporter ATP-binding protein [Gammaproteobacteria bacterium]